MDVIAKAQSKIDAIDKRIDAVRAGLYRVSGFDWGRFDLTTREGNLAACIASGIIRRDFAGYDGIEQSLFVRRHTAADVRDDLLVKQAKAEERRIVREMRKQYEAKRNACPQCGYSVAA